MTYVLGIEGEVRVLSFQAAGLSHPLATKAGQESVKSMARTDFVS